MEKTLDNGTRLNPIVTLSDGRKFTYKDIFQTYIRSGLTEEYMREALIQIKLSNIEVDETIISELTVKENAHENYHEVKFCINGIDSNDDEFCYLLNNIGKCVPLK